MFLDFWGEKKKKLKWLIYMKNRIYVKPVCVQLAYIFSEGAVCFICQYLLLLWSLNL